MSEGVIQHLEKTTQKLAHLYFDETNFNDLASYLSDNMSWVGSGSTDILYTFSEALHFLRAENQIFSHRLEIYNDEYKGILVNDSTILIIVKMYIRNQQEESFTLDIPLRFSILWTKTDGMWKIAHIHNSVPNESLMSLLSREETNTMDSSQKKQIPSINQVLKASTTDPLTKIHNLEGFEQEASKIFKTSNQKYALIRFSINNFRYINKLLTYDFGDQILVDAAHNLSALCEEGETCARIENVSFAMLYKFTNKRKLNKRMNELQKSLISPEYSAKLRTGISFTAGIYLPEDPKKENIKDMLDCALLAKQHVVTNMRGTKYEYYSNWMLDQKVKNMHIVESAPAAMRNHEFKLFIQPQFSISTLKVIAGEALCRWILPDGKVIPPNDFIPLFEEYGMISSFDFYMLELLCKTMREWMDEGRALKSISINQSRIHIEEEDYLERFIATVDKYGIPHEYIAFELTESAFVEQDQKMLALSNALHQQGFLLALDDFGTGYASLNILSRIAVDILKIDKSLLNIEENKNAQVILEQVISMAHKMDMICLCEGIEKLEQLQYLQKLGCDIGQGYLIGIPTKADDFKKAWMKERNTK